MRKGWSAAFASACLVALLPTLPARAEPGPGDGVDLVSVIVRTEPGADPAAAADQAEQDTDGQVSQVLEHSLVGYLMTLPADQVAQLAADPAVADVTLDRPIEMADNQTPAPWNLDRIDDVRGLDNSYRYVGFGSGATVYVIDSGIRITHREFGGRARYGWNFVDDNANADDCAGHGTHVAATVAGATRGVAKQTKLVALKVFDCAGNGQESGLLAAIDWVLANRAPGPAVINASIAGQASALVDDAVAAATAAGVPVVVAAGNRYRDACSGSPARAPSAITVGATDRTDSRAPYSNYGSCVDLFAPGDRVTSAGIASDTATTERSGTSMAAPLVSGALARYLAGRPTATPAEAQRWLISQTRVSALDARSACAGILFVPPALRGPFAGRPDVTGTEVAGSACKVQLSTGGGGLVTLFGHHLDTVTRVTVDGRVAAVTTAAADTMTVRIPLGRAVGTTHLVLTGPAGQNPVDDAASVDLYFADAGPTSPYFADIWSLTSAGALIPASGGLYRPADPLRRGAMMAMLWRMDHPGVADPTCTGRTRMFVDVPAGLAECGAIEWAARAGLSGGFADRTFRPSSGVVRSAAMTLLHRFHYRGMAIPACRGGSRTFVDVPSSNPHCRAIEVMADLGIVEGSSSGAFRPNAVVSRGSGAQMIARVGRLTD